jgi:hypothetical protein
MGSKRGVTNTYASRTNIHKQLRSTNWICNANTITDTSTNSFTNAKTHSNPNANTNTNPNSNPKPYTKTNRNSNPNTSTNSFTNAKTYNKSNANTNKPTSYRPTKTTTNPLLQPQAHLAPTILATLSRVVLLLPIRSKIILSFFVFKKLFKL